MASTPLMTINETPVWGRGRRAPEAYRAAPASPNKLRLRSADRGWYFGAFVDLHAGRGIGSDGLGAAGLTGWAARGLASNRSPRLPGTVERWRRTERAALARCCRASRRCSWRRGRCWWGCRSACGRRPGRGLRGRRCRTRCRSVGAQAPAGQLPQLCLEVGAQTRAVLAFEGAQVLSLPLELATTAFEVCHRLCVSLLRLLL